MAKPLVAILGAGPVGRALGQEFEKRGQSVRFLTRSGRGPAGADTKQVVAEDPVALARAAEGATVLVHAAGLPYPQWVRGLPPLQTSVLAAAQSLGALALFVDNLYAYGPGPMPLTEATVEAPVTKKGEVRRRIALQWKEAHASGRVKAAAVQASDYFGPGATRSATSHIGSRFFPRLEAGQSVAFLGDPTQPHALTYLPDFARALVDVALEPSAWGRAWIAPSIVTNYRHVAEEFARLAGRSVSVGRLPKPLLRALGLFDPTIREVVEMVVQFDRPFTVDASAFEKKFGWSATPLDMAIKETWEAHRTVG